MSGAGFIAFTAVVVFLLWAPCSVNAGYNILCKDPVYCASPSSSSSSSGNYQPCFNNTCLNGGSCVIVNDNDYVCLCLTNFYGEHCEAETGVNVYNETSFSECIGLCDAENNKPDIWKTSCQQSMIVGEDSSCEVKKEAKKELVELRNMLQRVSGFEEVPLATPQSDGYWDESTEANTECRGHRARLNADYGSGCDGWRAVDSRASQWVLVRWDNDVVISRIAIQPRRDAHEWAKQIKLYYRSKFGGHAWKWLQGMDEDGLKTGTSIIDIFQTTGPADLNTIKYYTLPRMIIVYEIRVYVETWNSIPAMRMELYGMHVTQTT